MSLYQKYRAKSFSEILTQNHVKDVLQSSVKNNSFGHAYLFVGTRGTGKTSLARIFARALNCQNKDLVNASGEPCNECESCKLSLSGSHPDIIEMDAASNRGIEEVRNLKEAVDFLPSMGTHKVYIIDEAHMMTKEAFNALLKTIEEPPKHIVFIMCTTELYKVPATIVSRSQVFELKNATTEEIISKIDVILSQEGTGIDYEGKKLIAKLGKGSFRDTESILEKVINNAGDKTLTLDEVVTSLGLTSMLLVDQVKSALYTKDLKKVQEILQNELDEGSVSTFNYQLADIVYQDIVENLDSNKVDPFTFELFDFLASVDKELRNTTNPRLVYVAKLLNFIKNFSLLTTSSNIVQNQPLAQQTVHNDENVDTSINPERMKKNPSELLRARMKKQATDISEPQKELDINGSQQKFVSKIDFLNFMKEKNSFLFRFFSTHEFGLETGKLIVSVEKQLEKDLLLRTQTLDLINLFGTQHGIELKIEFGEPKIDKRKTEEKQVSEIQKTVADLDEDELNKIFKS